VKATKILAAATITLALICSGCGASDSVKSITLTGTSTASTSAPFEVFGEGGTAQMQVIANYNSGKTVDVTAQSTFTATATGYFLDGSGNDFPMPDPYTAYNGMSGTPPTTIEISATGLVTAVQPFLCSYVITSGTATTVSYAVSGSYQIIATYKGMQSNAQFLPVASATVYNPNNVTGASCGPLP